MAFRGLRCCGGGKGSSSKLRTSMLSGRGAIHREGGERQLSAGPVAKTGARGMAVATNEQKSNQTSPLLCGRFERPEQTSEGHPFICCCNRHQILRGHFASDTGTASSRSASPVRLVSLLAITVASVQIGGDRFLNLELRAFPLFVGEIVVFHIRHSWWRIGA